MDLVDWVILKEELTIEQYRKFKSIYLIAYGYSHYEFNFYSQETENYYELQFKPKGVTIYKQDAHNFIDIDKYDYDYDEFNKYMGFYNDSSVVETKCECGGDKLTITHHYDWCPKHIDKVI